MQTNSCVEANVRALLNLLSIKHVKCHKHRVEHPLPLAFSTYVGYVLAQGTYLTFYKM